MKHFAILFAAMLAAIFASQAFAAPASPHTAEITQPDGTRITVRAVGDEYWNALELASGETLLKNPQGYWVYAQSAQSGELIETAARAGIDQAPANIQKHLRPSPRRIELARRAAQPARASGARHTPGVSKVVPFVPSGQRPLIVLVIGFNDRAIDTMASDWSDRFFGASGSVKDYYDEASGGQFDLVPATESNGTADDGIVFVNINRNHPNTPNAADPAYDDTAMLAIQAADPDVDFSAFDTNTDGYVSTQELGIFFVLAGYNGAAAGAPSPSVWPFATSFGGNGIAADGVQVSAYFGDDDARSGGITYQSEHDDGAMLSQIGVPCHEFGHNLGLPDLYDTSDASEGCGVFCMMAGGPWNDAGGEPGSSPAHFSAWCRVELGWETPSVLTIPGTYSLDDAVTATANQKVARVNIAGNDQEWFLIENRNGAGYDAGLPSSSGERGLLVWHINNANFGQQDVNNAPNFLVDLEEASATQHLELNPSNPQSNQGSGEDYWRMGGSALFDAATTPNSNDSMGSASGVKLRVTSAGGTNVTFDLEAPDIPVILSDAPTQALAGSAFSYTVDAAATPAATIMVSNLPAWLSFDGTDTISGTANAADIGMTFNFTITASNTNGMDTQAVALDVVGPPVITGMDYFELLHSASAQVIGENLAGVTSLSVGGVMQTITGTSATTVDFTLSAATPTGVQTLTVMNAQSQSDSIEVEVFATAPMANSGTVSFNPSFAGKIGTVVTITENPTVPGGYEGRSVEIGGVKQLIISRDDTSISFAVVGGTAVGMDDLDICFRGSCIFFPSFPVSAPDPLMNFVSQAASVMGGEHFEVDGANAPSITGVSIGGVAAAFRYVDADTIRVTTPLNAPVGTGQTLRLTNSQGDLDLTIDVTGAPTGVAPSITSTAPTTATEGVLYSYTVTASGMPAPTFTTNTLPTWLTFDGTATISGTPGAGDVGPSSSITITATNATGTDMETFMITVSAMSAPTAPSITSTASTTALVGSLYSYTVTADGNPSPTFSTNTLPAWLTFDGTDTISGTPTMTDLGPTSSIEITATNSEGTDMESFVITVSDMATAPSITSTAVTTATVGNTYQYTITADGLPAPTFTVMNNPGWLTLNGDALRGTPAAGDVGATAQITVTASNAGGMDTQTFVINVLPMGVTPPMITAVNPSTVMGGEMAVISGSGLGSASVRIAGVFQSIVSNTGVELTIRVSAASPNGTQTLRVANANGSASFEVTVVGGTNPNPPSSSGGGGGDSGGCALGASSSGPWALLLLALLLLALRSAGLRPAW